MANEKKVEIKKVEAKQTPANTPKKSVVDYIKEELTKGAKDRSDASVKAFDKMTKAGMTKNSKGNVITQENVHSLLNAMLRDITNERKGWWSTFELKESETEIKLIVKKQF